MQSFKLKFLGVTILQGVEFPIFLLIFEWDLQQCSATALPVIRKTLHTVTKTECYYVQQSWHQIHTVGQKNCAIPLHSPRAVVRVVFIFIVRACILCLLFLTPTLTDE